MRIEIKTQHLPDVAPDTVVKITSRPPPLDADEEALITVASCAQALLESGYGLCRDLRSVAKNPLLTTVLDPASQKASFVKG
jgi:hypothetical protein